MFLYFPVTNLYFYHSNHLGSSSFITDVNGVTSQHLQYLPFGELFVEQRDNSNYYSPYKFSAKEKDEETSYSYFGARYLASDFSFWLSVDPMADKYPNISPYAYCAWNPVILVDPDGRNYDEWNINLANGKTDWVSNKGGKETTHINVLSSSGKNNGSYAFPTENFQMNYINNEGNISLDIKGGNENNYASLGMNFTSGLNNNGELTSFPRNTDGVKIPDYMNYTSPSGGALSIGGVFCPLMGPAIDVGIAFDGKGKSAPFLNIAFAVGVDLGAGINYTKTPSGTGLKDFATPGGSGSVNASASFFNGSYSSGSYSGGLTVGMPAGLSFRANKTILGSWSEMGDYYSKVGHLTR